MSQQSEMAADIYCRLSAGPIPTADLVRHLRNLWGVEHSVAEVHGFVREVAALLLRHEEVEIGDLIAGRFVGWPLAPWDADQKIDAELMAMDEFLDDGSRFVFRKR